MANFIHVAEMIEKFGPALGALYTKYLGEGLFDIRAKGKEGKVMRPSFKEFKQKSLANPDVAKEYHELAPAYALRKQLIRIRKDAGFTQEELAKILLQGNHSD